MGSCSDIASGTRVQLAFSEEDQCGVLNPAFNAFDTPELDKTGAVGQQCDLNVATPVPTLLVGHMVYITSSNNPAQNTGWWRVVAKADDSNWSLFDEDDVMVNDAIGGLTAKLSLETLRATGRQLDRKVDTLESEEVRADRQYADVRQGFIQVEGSPGYELSSRSYDEVLKGVMSDDWYDVPYNGGNLGMTAAVAGLATLTRTAGSWLTDGYRIGDRVRTAGFTTGGGINNRDWVITEITNALNVKIDDLEEVAVTEAAAGGQELSFPGQRIDIGLILRAYTFEQRFNDIDKHRAFLGCTFNEMGWNVSPESIVNGTLGILGMDSLPLGASIVPEGPSPALTTSVYAALNGRMYEGGVRIAVATSMEFSINNQRTLEGVIGQQTSPGIFEGRCSVEGTMTVFFRGTDIYNKFQDELDSSLSFTLADPNDDQQFFNVVMPKVKYITGEIDPPAEGPVPLVMSFRALTTEVNHPTKFDQTTSISIQKSNQFA